MAASTRRFRRRIQQRRRRQAAPATHIRTLSLLDEPEPRDFLFEATGVAGIFSFVTHKYLEYLCKQYLKILILN
jgi:hypothetical protein